MRNAYVQVDKQGNQLGPVTALPKQFKGMNKFDELNDTLLAKYGWRKTNMSQFQATLGQFKINSDYKVIFTKTVRAILSTRYIESMKTVVWKAIATGIVYEDRIYLYSYHHQMQMQNACLVGCNVTRYNDNKKEVCFLDTESAKKLLRKQIENMDFLKSEYNFYCNKMSKGFSGSNDYDDLYKAFKSAMKNERY